MCQNQFKSWKEINHNINWIIYPKWMPPANSFVRLFTSIGLSECLLFSSYMWVSLMYTLWHGLCLVSYQIRKLSKAPEKPPNCRELLIPPVKSASLVGLGLESWLDFYDLMFLKLGVIGVFHWHLCKAEEGKTRAFTTTLVSKGHRFGIPLCLSGCKELEKSHSHILEHFCPL